MSEDNSHAPGTEAPPVEVKLPICPYCQQSPFNPAAIPFNTNNGIALLIFHCSDCAKVINIALIPEQRRIVPGRPGIVRPS